VRLLAYFGEHSEPCGNCDSCLHPPETWDATEAARKALSCVFYRFHQRGERFGAGHLIDVLRGKRTDKVVQRGHDSLSTFGIGADWSETQWRSLLRQLIAREVVAVASDGFNTLSLTDAARPLLKGEVRVMLRSPRTDLPRDTSRRRGSRDTSAADRKASSLAAAAHLSAVQQQALDALKAWRRAVAKEHNLPAFVIFPDSTLLALAERMPQTLADLQGVPGVGQKKREAYGPQVLEALEALHPVD